MDEFYSKIAEYIEDEEADNDKYKALAEMAPTEKAKTILNDIASEEHTHMMFLKEILKDRE